MGIFFFGGGGVLIAMHGRGRATKDHPIPTIPGRSTSGFHRPGRHYLLQARSAMRCSGSPVKGEQHQTKNRLSGGLSCIWMTASNELICFLVWTLPETVMGVLCRGGGPLADNIRR